MILLPHKCQVHDLQTFLVTAWLNRINAVLIALVDNNIIADFDRYFPNADQLAYLLAGSFGCVKSRDTDNSVSKKQVAIMSLNEHFPRHFTRSSRVFERVYAERSICKHHDSLTPPFSWTRRECSAYRSMRGIPSLPLRFLYSQEAYMMIR